MKQPHRSRTLDLKIISRTILIMALPLTGLTIQAQAQTFQVLYTFHGADGAGSAAPLFRGAAGSLYGTTVYGGDSSSGVVFKLDAAQNETVLHSFTAGEDGASPFAGLSGSASGNKFGGTFIGGDLNCSGPYGCGVIYKLARNDTFSVVHSLEFTEGYFSESTLLKAGKFYGAATGGGTFNAGTVYEVTASGKLTVLYSFGGAHPSGDGQGPIGKLTQDAAGNLYGTTYNGGIVNNTTCQILGCGTVFKLTPSAHGWKETILYRFTGAADGGYPVGGVTLDSHGNIYGLASNGGGGNCNVGCGTIFKLTRKSGKWNETVIYTFTGGADGGYPSTNMAADKAGNFYGATNRGGNTNCNAPNGCGVIFRLDASGHVTTLHAFVETDGAGPDATPLVDPGGHTLYGTTSYGGDTSCSSPYGSGCGTVYQLTY